MMDEIVTQYLPQAFAFIYVINSANAGGVQKDRVSSKYNTFSSKNQKSIPSTKRSTLYSAFDALFKVTLFIQHSCLLIQH